MDSDRQVRSRRQPQGAHPEAQRPARMIVPAILAVCFLVVIVTIGTAGKPANDQAKAGSAATSQQRDSKKSNDKPAAAPGAEEEGRTSDSGPALYKVKPGDSLAAIATDTGVETSELAELNPDIDPRALQPGQQLKLR